MKRWLVGGVVVLIAIVAFAWAAHEPAGGEQVFVMGRRVVIPKSVDTQKRTAAVERVSTGTAIATVATTSTPEPAPAPPRTILASPQKCPADGGIARDCFRCSVDADCQQGLSCGVDEAGGLSCLANGCDSDADCEGSLACRVVTMPGLGREAKQCRPGAVPIGKRCEIFSTKEQQSCARGLLCSLDEKCSKACEKKSDCGAGESCVKQPIEQTKICAKTCSQDSDCPASLTCVGFGDNGAYCRSVTSGENCQFKGCGAGEACQIFETFAKSVAFECSKCCNPIDSNSCGAGFVCGRSHSGVCQSTCYRACKSPFDCADGGQNVACITVNEDLDTNGCVPSVSRATYRWADGGVMSIEDMRKMGMNVRDVYE